MTGINPLLIGRFDRWLYFGLLGLILAFGPVSYLAIASIKSVDAQRTYLTERYARALTLSKDLLLQQSDEDNLALRATLSSANRVPDIDRERTLFAATVNQLAGVDQSSTTRTVLDRISEMEHRLAKATAPGLMMRRQGYSADETFIFMEHTGLPINLEINHALAALFDLELLRFWDFRAAVNKTTDRVVAGVTAALALFGCFIVLVSVVILKLARTRTQLEQARAKAHQQLEETAQARKDVVAAVAHDLKNPLSAIQMSMEWSKRCNERGDAKKSATALENASRALATMNDYIQMLLDDARMEGGMFRLDLETVDVEGIIRNAIELLRPLADSKSIELVAVQHESSHSGEFDRRQIGRVLANIIGNAIKFTPDGGRVTVTSGVKQGAIAVQIADSGPGIAPEQLDHVFDRFWQAHSAQRHGSGLGLAIAKEIVTAHGGTIWAESTEGRGAVFEFLIPLTRSRERTAPVSRLVTS